MSHMLLADADSNAAFGWTALLRFGTRFFPSINFADPVNGVLAAILLPLLLGLFVVAIRRYWRLRTLYGKKELVDRYSDRVSLIAETIQLCMRLAVPGLLLIALANPYITGAPHRVPVGTRQYVICVADNRGMGVTDMGDSDAGTAGGAEQKGVASSEPATHQAGDIFFHEHGSRFDFVRRVIRQLLNGPLIKTPVSIVAFQGEANLLVPLTDSSDWLNDTIDPNNKFGLRVAMSAPIGESQVDGKVTSIASCLQAARNEFERDGIRGHEKFIIYFGNGDDISDRGWLAEESKKLKEEKVRGMIFGVGNRSAPIPVYTGDDEQFAGYYKFNNGREALSGYNEENLLNLSQLTGWKYLHLEPKAMPDLDFLTQALTDSKVEFSRRYIFSDLVVAALLLMLLLSLSDKLDGAKSMLNRLSKSMRLP